MALYVNSTVNGLKIGIPGTTPSSKNTAVGEFALYDITSGYRNTAVGHQALSNTTTTIDNTAVGTQVLRDNIGSSNTGIGSYSLLANTSGHSNTCLGYSSGNQISDGVRNICLGYRAGLSITSGSGNTIIGANILGTAALTDTVIIGVGNGVERLRIHGDGALSINTTNLTNYGQTSNSFNINNAGGTAGNWSWRRDTGAVIQATDADSGWALMYLNKYEWNSGDDSRWISFYLNGQVKDTISWNGSSIIYGQGSDYRVKENIREFTNGIDKVKQLKVHLYDYIDPDRGTDHIGFIAHELQEIIPDAVSGEKDGMRKEEDTGNDVMDIQMVDYGKLTPVLTAALQEAIAEIETLRARLDAAGL